MISRAVISMDSAKCIIAEDGNVEIKKTTGGNWLAIILVTPFLLLLTWSILNSVIRRDPEQFPLGAVVIALVLIVLLIGLVRPLRRPSIKFNSPAKTMEIGRGNSARRIPFSNISQIAAQPHTTSIAILASLENGEVLRLGSLSGVGTIEQDTIARAASIVQYIEAAIGTDKRQEQLSEKDGQSPDFPKATSVSPIWKQGLKFGVVFGGLLTAVLSYALYQSGAELNLVVLAFSSLLSFALYTAIFSVIGMALIWIWRLALRLARQFRKN